MRTAVVVGGVLLCVLGATVDQTDWWSWTPGLLDGRPLVVIALVLVVVAGAITVSDDEPALRRAGAVGAVATAAVVAWPVTEAFLGGFPGASGGLLAAGVVAVVAGAVARAVRPPHVPRRPTWQRLGRGAAALVVVVAVGLAIGTHADDLGIRSTTTSSPATDEAVVEIPEAPRWRWDAGGPVSDVIAIRGGVAVTRPTPGGDEIVGLDGATGTPRWTFRRVGQEVLSVNAAPGGGAVVVQQMLPDDRVRTMITVLDAVSGRVRTDLVARPRTTKGDALVHLTDRVLTVVDEPPEPPQTSPRTEPGLPARLVAHALDDGREVWSSTPPAGCAIAGSAAFSLLDPVDRVLGTRDTVVAWADCVGPEGRGRVLTGLDDSSGASRWTVPPIPISLGGYRVERQPDLVALPDGGGILADGSPPQIADAASGATRAVPDLGQYDLVLGRPGPVRPLRMADVWVGERRPDATLDPATGIFAPLPAEAPGECSTPAGAVVVTTSGTLVRLCGVGPGFGVRVGTGPTQPVDLGPPRLLPPEEFTTGATYGRSAFALVPAPGAFVVATTRTSPAVVLGFGR